jgi:hypothetical protein
VEEKLALLEELLQFTKTWDSVNLTTSPLRGQDPSPVSGPSEPSQQVPDCPSSPMPAYSATLALTSAAPGQRNDTASEVNHPNSLGARRPSDIFEVRTPQLWGPSAWEGPPEVPANQPARNFSTSTFNGQSGEASALYSQAQCTRAVGSADSSPLSYYPGLPVEEAGSSPDEVREGSSIYSNRKVSSIWVTVFPKPGTDTFAVTLGVSRCVTNSG